MRLLEQLAARIKLTDWSSRTAQAVVSHVLASVWYQRARNVSCYLSTPTGEVNTDGIILDALRSGAPHWSSPMNSLTLF